MLILSHDDLDGYEVNVIIAKMGTACYFREFN